MKNINLKPMQFLNSSGKYQEPVMDKKFVSTFDGGTLFPVNMLDAVVKHACPYCGCRLYEMRNKAMMFCKSTKHKNKFIIAKAKLR